MTLVSLLDRTRTRDRARPRPNAPGNFVSLQYLSETYAIQYGSTPQNYIKWWPYFFPETKAIGYKDDPVPTPPMVRIGPGNGISTVLNITDGLIPGAPGAALAPSTIPPSLLEPPQVNPIFTPQPIPTSDIITSPTNPSNLNENSQLTQQAANQAGQTFTKVVTTTPSQIFVSKTPIRGCTILAEDLNGGDVWVGYDPQVTVGNGFKLVPGAAKDFNIDDLSAIWLVGSAGSLQVHVEYTR